MRMKRLLWVILTLTMVLGMNLTAYADGQKAYADYDVTTEANKTKSGEKLTALQVKFNEKSWYIIADNSTAVDAGTVTLLAAESLGTSKFHDSSNKYSTSTIKTTLDNMTASGGSFAGVASAINTVKVKGSENDSEVDAKLYLLNTTEANYVPENVLKFSTTWWLRSPSSKDHYAAFVSGEYGYIYDNRLVHTEFGVRPALKLKLSSVIFSSESKTFSLKPAGYSVILTGGTNATPNPSDKTTQTGLTGAMTPVVYTADNGYYFPEGYSVTSVNGISVTRNSYTRITVYGTPTADTEITLSDATPKAEATVRVVWNDNNNRDGTRPSSLTFDLYADGVKDESKSGTLNESTEWKYTATDLIGYKNGADVRFTWNGPNIDGYSVTESKENSTTTFTYSRHVHSFTYSASGATITATCTAYGCTLPPSTDGGSDHVAKLTISANGGTYDGTTAYGVTITDANRIQDEAKIQYQKKTDGSYGTATETAPTEAGDYKASITLDGATASVEYSIATPYPLWVGGVQVTSENAKDTTSHPTWSYETTTNTLTLNGANISSGSGISAAIRSEENLTIDVTADSTVSGLDNTNNPNSFGINVLGNLTIKGSGTLTATAGEASYSSGVYANNVTVEKGGKLTATSGKATASSYGVDAQGVVTVEEGGKLTATGGKATSYSYGVHAGGEVTVEEGGTLDAMGGEGGYSSCGVDGGGAVTVKGTLTATSGEAFFYSYGVYAEEVNVEKSGTLDATGGNATYYSYGIWKNGTVTVKGTLTATGNTQAIDGTVKNAIPGTGWTNTAGTEGEEAIEASTTWQSLSKYKKVHFLGVPFTVTYDSNGATSGNVPSDSNSPYISGSTVTVLSKGTLTKNGYSFAGWKMGDKTYANNSDGISGAQTSFTITGNTTLTAQWTPIDATAPTISSQPQNLNLTYGYTEGSVNVTATAATDTTYGNLVYQWYSCDSDGNNGTAINVSTEPTAATSAYTIPTGKNVEQSPLYYYCVVTASRADNGLTATATSNVATVTIYQLKETAPTNDEAKAQLNIDYQNETISINTGYDLASDNHGTEITNFSSILDNTQPTVYVRKKATDANHSASDWVEVTLAARPTEPTGLGSTNATSGSSADGTITGVNNTMEYSSDGTNWHDVTGTTITGLNPGSYYVRVKATDNAPHGVASTVNVGNGFVTLSDTNKPTITLPNSHTVPIVGDTLTASTSASNVTYQWYVNGIAIPNATDATYTVRAEDYGKTIYVEAIQNTDSSGTNLTTPTKKQSATTAAVVKKDNSSAPSNATEAGFSPNYLADTFTVDDSYEVSSTNSEPAQIMNGSLTDVLDGTGKVYIRKKETDDTKASAWLEVTLPSRPTEPTGLGSTNATSGSSADGTITGVNNTMEYSSDGTNWYDVTGTTITGLNPGSYYVRVKATSTAPHGVATTVDVGNGFVTLSGANKPTISLPNSHTVPIVGDTLTASTSASNVTYQWYVNGIAIPNATDTTYTVRAEDYGKTIYVEAIQNTDSSGTNLTTPTKKQSSTTAAVVKKDNSSAPTNVSETGFSLNYLAETFTVDDSYEVSSTNSEPAQIMNGSLTDVLDGTGKVYIRKKETDDTKASAWLEVTLPSRPTEPTGLGSTSATSGSSADGTITGVDNTMEYSSDNGASWNPITSTPITGLNPGSYSVRVRATDNAPHGKATVVTVGNKEVINLTDTQKPTAKTNLAVKSTFQKLVDAPVDPLPQGATEIQYALGTDAVTPPTSGWSTSIPEGKDEGTYFVWYKVIGSANYLDTVPVCIQVTISVYKYTTGDGSTWTKNSGLSLYFEIKNTVNDINTFSNFREISVDDRQYVDHDNYDAESGSVQITLKAAYLETLAVGEHKLTAYFDGDYTADAKFTVLESPVDPDSLPRTGDKSNVLIYAFAGLMAVAGLVFLAKRKRI